MSGKAPSASPPCSSRGPALQKNLHRTYFIIDLWYEAEKNHVP